MSIWFSVSFSLPKFWKARHECLNEDINVSENKTLSVQISTPWSSKSIFDVFEFTLCITWKQSHSGARIELGLLGFYLLLDFADKRHWYKEKNRWYLPGEEAELYKKRQ